MKLYNSLTRSIEKFEPKNPPKVGMYTCGPTVYSYVTIGNWRTYVLGDLLYRALKYLGHDVTYIMNITDVGHLTGDNLGDADTGDDRLEKAAEKEGKSAWDIAAFYTSDFLHGFDQLNLIRPKEFTKATDYISEQIDLVKRIESRGFAYQIEDGVYFDTKAYEAAGYIYGELSNLDQIIVGARVEPAVGKKDPRDFALWKLSPRDKKRHMEWDSPWGVGFPGWHIECSAMSMKHLGEQFDLHIGGDDLKSTHHPNEIAQSQAATGCVPFVRMWVHGAFLLVDGGRMGKSLGNAYTLADIENRNIDPLALRYFYLSGHYRKQLNFTWEAVESAQKAFSRLKSLLAIAKNDPARTALSHEKQQTMDDYRLRFKSLIEDDLKMPEVIALVWEVLKSNIPNRDIYDLVMGWDEVLGLGLGKESHIEFTAPDEILLLVERRQQLRIQGKYDEADVVRRQIEALGYRVEDAASGAIIKKL